MPFLRTDTFNLLEINPGFRLNRQKKWNDTSAALLHTKS